MRLSRLLIVVCLFCFFFCNKKKKQNSNVITPEPPPVTDTLLNCRDLPPAPQPFGWTDTTLDVDKSINAFFVNPLNPNEIVYIVNGDIRGYNKMFMINIPSGKITFLASVGNYLPDVNKYGWIVFSSVDHNIFKIKCNGDSLRQLTTNKLTQDPKWDHTGKNILYYQSAYSNIPTKLLKINPLGALVLEEPMELPHSAAFKTPNKIIYLRTKTTTATLVLKDFDTSAERDLISGTYNPKADPIVFDNLTLDNADEHFFWSNEGGIFKCNLNTLKIDTVLKNCPNKIYTNPYILPSNPNMLTYARHELRALNTFKMYHEYKAFQLNLITKEITETRIFP